MAALSPLKRLGRGLALWAAGDFLPVAFGGTGATTAAAARSNLGAAASGANTDVTSLASPALGAATASTATSGDNSTKVETTAFSALYGVRADLAQSLTAAQMAQALANLGVTASIGTTGYVKLNNGSGTPVIVQWGSATTPSSGSLSVGYPVSFPNGAYATVVTAAANSSVLFSGQVSSVTKSGFLCQMTQVANGGTVQASSVSFYWISVGY